MTRYNSAEELIGNTPLVRLDGFARAKGFEAVVWGKVEARNPGGSAKDRAAKAMFEDARKRGILDSETVIIEPTSGNMGISLAALAAVSGMRIIICMPDTMSVERQKLMTAYGAELVLTPGATGMAGAIEEAERLHEQIPNSFIPSQFTNPANPKAHYESTGPEIWNDLEGAVDYFVAGVGTGGTLSGTGAFLKEMNPDVKIIAVEPADSPLLSEGRSGAHGLQGIGANFVPETLDTTVYDEVIAITTEEAYEAARQLARRDGLLVGISSGASLAAAAKLAQREEARGKNIVALLPDTGERYLSTDLF